MSSTAVTEARKSRKWSGPSRRNRSVSGELSTISALRRAIAASTSPRSKAAHQPALLRSRDSSRVSCEVLVDELDGHRSLADCGGAALGRAGADVAGGENPGHACPEQSFGADRVAGEDEAVGGACDGVVEPIRVRRCAEKAEEERERKALAAGERDRFELTVGAVELGDLAAVADGDAVAVELAGQVVGHCLAQVGATVEEGHERTAAGEPDGRLAGGVAAADDADT